MILKPIQSHGELGHIKFYLRIGTIWKASSDANAILVLRGDWCYLSLNRRSGYFWHSGFWKKNRTVSQVIDFCWLNTKLVCREYPLSMTKEILISIHGQFHSMKQHSNSHSTHEYLMLPMGIIPVTDMFQAWMVHAIARMGEWCPFPYVDDILHFKGEHLDSTGPWQDHRASSQVQTSSQWKGLLLSTFCGILRILAWPHRVQTAFIFPATWSRYVVSLGLSTSSRSTSQIAPQFVSPSHMSHTQEQFLWGDEQQLAFDKIKAIFA